MIGTPYLFREIYDIFHKTPYYALVLEAALGILVVWLVFYKKSSRNRLSAEQKAQRIADYQPDPIVPDISDDDPALLTKCVTSTITKRITVDSYDCLNLGTHDYLGLLGDEKFHERAIKSIRKYGVGSCGPRGFYGTLDVHLELEDRLAKFMSMEEAAIYSYGFSTIASAIPAYAKKNDICFVDEMVNFSIQKGLDAARCKVQYFKHNDMKDLEAILMKQDELDKKNPKKAMKTRKFLIAEAIYMNTGEMCPLPELVKLRQKYKLRMILDESITFGVLGATGRGLTEHLDVDRNEVDLISASLEWSVASIGGFCVGSSFIVDHQRLSGLGYCFSASAPPSLVEACIAALDKFEEEPSMFAELSENCRSMQESLAKLTYFKTSGHELSPVKHLYLKEQSDHESEKMLLRKLVDLCIEKGLALITPPYLEAIEKKSLRPSIRITVNRKLDSKDIEFAINTIETVSKMIF